MKENDEDFDEERRILFESDENKVAEEATAMFSEMDPIDYRAMRDSMALITAYITQDKDSYGVLWDQMLSLPKSEAYPGRVLEMIINLCSALVLFMAFETDHSPIEVLRLMSLTLAEKEGVVGTNWKGNKNG